MPKFVIDESLSPLLAAFIEELGFDATSVRGISLICFLFLVIHDKISIYENSHASESASVIF